MNRVEVAYLLGWPTPPKDSDLLDRVESVVKRAILAEREACATLVETLLAENPDLSEVYVAAEIRARGEG
jgi:hypothetical protein